MLHVIGANYHLLTLTAPKALAGLGQCAEGARRAGAVRRRRPPAGQCQAILTMGIHGQCQGSSVNGVKAKPKLRHSTPPTPPTPPTPRHSTPPTIRHYRPPLDANKVQASMLTGLVMCRCLCGKCARGITTCTCTCAPPHISSRAVLRLKLRPPSAESA
jgi:hypothetical protein